MSWFGFALLSTFFSVITGLLMRVLAIKSRDPRAFSFNFNVIAGIIAAILFIPQAVKLTFSISIGLVFLIGLASLLYGIFERTQFYARKHIEASTFSILSRLSPVITFIASIVLLSESFTIQKLAGSVLIIGANLLLIYKKGALRFERNWIYMIIPMIAIGLARTVDRVVTGSFPAEIYNIVIWLVPLVFIYFPFIPLSSLKRELRIGVWKIALTAFANVLTFYYLLKAFELAEASRVVMIASTGTILVVVAGIFLLNEKSHLKQKIIAGIAAVFGVLLIR